MLYMFFFGLDWKDTRSWMNVDSSYFLLFLPQYNLFLIWIAEEWCWIKKAELYAFESA
jgi:hypothetical protein